MSSKVPEGVAVSADGLFHVYKPRGSASVTALDHVTFDIRPGEVVGLLGPNGAGKTTCVRVLSTLLLPTRGSASIGGVDVVKHPRTARSKLGVSFGGDLGLYTRLSARDNLRYFGTMYRLDPSSAADRIESLLEQVGLAERGESRVETFSRGMRQRLHLARAVLHDPEVLLLDEPSAGLDPQGARDVRTEVSRLATEGRAILLTTHDMAEAEELCSRLVVLDRGRIRRHGSPRAIRQEASKRLGTVVEIVDARGVEESMLRGVPGLLRWQWKESDLRVYTSEPTRATAHLLDRLDGEATIQVNPPSLVDAYLALMLDEGEGWGGSSTHS